MRNLFLLSVFGLFMIAATDGRSMANVTLVAPAFADNDTPEFRCPEGVSTCYRAYNSDEDSESNGEYTDPNNLPATAAGSEDDDDEGDTLVTVVKPVHFRSF